MSDAYQAVFDATRTSLRNTDVGEAIRSACQLDASYAIESLKHQFESLVDDMRCPSVIYRPRLFIDGNQWCALYGDDLQNGVAGFGDTPGLAMAAFDRAWHARLSAKAE